MSSECLFRRPIQYVVGVAPQYNSLGFCYGGCEWEGSEITEKLIEELALLVVEQEVLVDSPSSRSKVVHDIALFAEFYS